MENSPIPDLERDLTGTIWELTSYTRLKQHDEIIVQITRKPTRWRRWRGDKDVVYKVAFVGRAFDWYQQPRYTPITNPLVKDRLYGLWYDAFRGYF